MEKRVYSLNLAAFLISNNIEPYFVGIDDVTGNVYFKFEESNEVGKLINFYKGDYRLRDFLRSFEKVKQLVYEAKSAATV